MARTTKEIQETLQEQWMQNSVLSEMYGFIRGSRFVDFYSKTSIENLLLYIVAYCAYVIERLMDATTDEIEQRIQEQLPGTTLWYAQKMKDFRLYFTLDEWGNPIEENHTEAEIKDAAIIKHAVAIDDQTTGYLLLKVAGDNNGKRCSLKDYESYIQEYIMRIKYAGVKSKLIDEEGDIFGCNIEIWYDPLKKWNEVAANCKEAIQNYIENLPFNGEFSIMALTDNLQAVAGVKLVQVRTCYGIDANGIEMQILDKATPYAGYYQYTENRTELTMTPYEG